MNILQRLVMTFTVFGLSFENPISDQCGNKHLSTGMISNGTQGIRWPWMAVIIVKEDETFKAGATLISKKAVLTAAHCIQPKYTERRLHPNDFEVHLGRYNLSDNSELKKLARVLEPIIIIAMHPDWNPSDYKNHRYDADIALLISGKEVEFSPFVSPICLPSGDFLNNLGIVAGWGFSSDEKRQTEDIIRQAEVERVPLLKRLLEEGYLSSIASERTFCVKGVDGYASPCKGDSGGGLFVKSNNVWFIHGIVSSGMMEINCPSIMHSLFTDLSSFEDWIEQGINEFYVVKFAKSLKKDFYGHGGSYHQLSIYEVLRQGAFLSMTGSELDSEVDEIKCNRYPSGYRSTSKGYKWNFLPNNIGFLFPNLKNFGAEDMSIKNIERMNFKHMSQLEILILWDNEIEQIPSDCFKDLKSLVTVSMEKNKLKTIHPDTFVHNSFFRSIGLFENQIQPNELKNLKNKNVEELDLERNELETVPFDAFEGLKNIMIVILENNNLTTLPKDTFKNNLTSISVQRNKIKNIPDGLFRNQNNLKLCYFSDNQIQPTDLKNLKNSNVEELSLERNQLEFFPFNAFYEMPNLVKIYLGENNLSSIHRDTFLKNRKITSIYVQRNKIKNVPVYLFGNNKNLEVLALDGNQIQPDELKNLKNVNIKKLSIVRNQLRSIPFDAFYGMPNLVTIYLGENNLSSLHKDTFVNNPNLTELYAEYNRFENLPEDEELFRNNPKFEKFHKR